MYASSSSLEREIDEYQDVSSGVVVVVMRAVRVVQVIVVIAIPQTSIIRLGFLVFF